MSFLEIPLSTGWIDLQGWRGRQRGLDARAGSSLGRASGPHGKQKSASKLLV